MSTTYPTTFERILVGIDGSPQSEWAVHVAGQLASQLQARVLLVHVVEVDIPVDGDVVTMERVETLRTQFGKELLERTRLSLPETVEVETIQRTGVPSEQIAAVAKKWCADLIVIGTRGRGRLAHFVLGSTADAIIRQSPCPVISVAHESKCEPARQPDWVGVGADSCEPVSAHRN